VSEAEGDLHRILHHVEQGKTVIITRQGRSIARMSRDVEPEMKIDRERVQRAMDGIRELRKRTKPVSLEEILSARDEGRR
jgi:antitoxin (DNA-binding transcriptional repressor) of toxin-antitoxin stability system